MAKIDRYKIKTPPPKKPRGDGLWLFFSMALVCALLVLMAMLVSDGDIPVSGSESTSGGLTVVSGTRYTTTAKSAVTVTVGTQTAATTTEAAVTTGGTAAVTTSAATTTKKTTTKATTTTANPRRELTVCIDPGHGGRFPGAEAEYNGQTVYEKEIVLDIGLRAAEQLEYLGYNVLMTRRTDSSILSSGTNIQDVTARVNMAKNNQADLLVSIHCNAYAGSSRAYGPIVFYRDNDPSYSGKTFAELFADCIDAECGEIGVREARIRADNDYAVLKGSGLPSMLLETGFLTDPTERDIMMTEAWRERMAQAIVNFVESAYLNRLIK